MRNKTFFAIYVIVLAALAALCVFTSCTSLRYKKACEMVSSYAEETMDTGQMDDFLESPQGKAFCKYYNGK